MLCFQFLIKFRFSLVTDSSFLITVMSVSCLSCIQLGYHFVTYSSISFQSYLCSFCLSFPRFIVHHALHQVIEASRDSVVLIFLQDVHDYKLSRTLFLRRGMLRSSCTLDWPPQKERVPAFYQNLFMALGMTNRLQEWNFEVMFWVWPSRCFYSWCFRLGIVIALIVCEYSAFICIYMNQSCCVQIVICF